MLDHVGLSRPLRSPAAVSQELPSFQKPRFQPSVRDRDVLGRDVRYADVAPSIVDKGLRIHDVETWP